MATTQKDVAARAGVSRGIVSKVMHGGGLTIRVNPQTAERVRQVASELGYQPSALARNFRRQRTGQIGLMHGDGYSMFKFESGSRYFASLMDGIVHGAFKHRYTLGLCPDLFGPSPESAMSDGRFDGFIWYRSFPSAKNEERLKRCSAPIVFVHSRAAAWDDRFPTVICDNDQGIRLALEHLATLGHRRIAFAYEGAASFTESVIRSDAFLSHGARMGLEVHTIDGHVDAFGNRAQYAGIRNYLAQNQRATAIIAQNEQYAVDIMGLAKESGLGVPNDLSVVGFDSTAFCDHQTPPLTAISQPLHLIGETAVDLLVQWIEGHIPDPLERLLPCGLDVRGSTGPAPDSGFSQP